MRWRLLLSLLLVALLSVSAGAAKKEPKKTAKGSPGAMIDSLVATVENETISIEDLLLARQLLGRTGVWFSLSEPPTTITEPLLLEELIARTLLYNQARKMGFGEMSEKTVQVAMGAFREAFADDRAYGKFLLQYELRDDAVPVGGEESKNFFPLRKHFYRELIINQYVEKKINVQVRLGLPAYLAESQDRLRQAHPEAAPDELEHYAHRELFARKLLDHVADLRQRASVVVLRERK